MCSFMHDFSHMGDFPGGSDSKESACNVGDSGSIPGLGKSPGEGNCNPLRLDPWVGKISWRRELQPTPVFLPGKLHRQRILVDYSL